MSFDKQGYVLKPARLATGNSSSTGEAVSGVPREHIYPSEMTALGYDIEPSQPVEPYADMYSAAVLEAPEDITQYAVFAANTSQFSIVEEDFAVQLELPPETLVTPLSGTKIVGSFNDGTIRFAVRDEMGRSIASVLEIIIRRGDNGTPISVVGFVSFLGLATIFLL